MSAQSISESQNQKKPKVIYVMGAGRSGSTILGVALGNCEEVFDAGELEAWPRRSGVPNFGGEQRTRFWSDVRSQVHGDDLFGDRAWLCIEHSSVVFRADRWPLRGRLRQRYRQIAAELYRAVTNASDAPYIVDTSHYPLRFRELQTLENVDLYLVYLARDPRSVVSSFNRRGVNQKRKAPFAANCYLWLTHLLSVLTFLSHRSDRRLFLQYEDFIAKPESVMREILEFVGASGALPDFTALDTGIPFQGNRLLRSEVLALQSDTDSRTDKRRITALVQRPWTMVHSRLRPAVSSPAAPEPTAVPAAR